MRLCRGLQHAHARQQVELHGFARHRERTRDRRLRGDDRRGGRQQHQRRQQCLRRQRIEGIGNRRRRLQQQRALTEVVDEQCRPHQHQPGQSHGLAPEVAHVGVQRLGTGHRQEHGAEDDQRQARMRGEQPAARTRDSRPRAPAARCTISMAPSTASTTNHRIMMGPNSRPTRAVPRRWIANNATMTPERHRQHGALEVRIRVSPDLRRHSAPRWPA